MAGRKPTKNRERGRSLASKGLRRSGPSSKQPIARKPAVRRSGSQTIGDYLIQRLQDYGVTDVFGIPGDFVLQFYGMLTDSSIRVVGTTREDCAGYAADGYARVHGLGAVCVTYCVGGLSLCNSIAGAYAEKSPVIVISGAPGVEERRADPLLHHKVRDFNTQREVFEKITVASASLDDPLTAFREIDRCFEAAVRFKRPVFLELPRDRVRTEALFPHKPKTDTPVSDRNALREAIAEAANAINSAKQPVIIAGVEIHRFGLQDEVIKLAEKHDIPICATLLGKSVVSEKHPLYLGIYEGAMGRESVRKFVEESDCVILLGAFMTDINLGIYTANLDVGKCILVTADYLSQMSAADYVDKLPILYREFVEAYDFEDLPEEKRMFHSFRDLMERSPAFWEKFVRPMLDSEMAGMYRFLENTGQTNPYLQAIEDNVSEVRRRVQAGLVNV